MAGSPRPSFHSSDPGIRRLGVGGGGGGERPLRAQLVVASVLLAVLVAVPLYLWRRPGAMPGGGAGSASASASAAPSGLPQLMAPPTDAGRPERVRLGRVQRVKCAASAHARGQEGELCDALPYFEDALAKAIRENADCAPREREEGSVNYVLTIDFSAHALHVFPGKSGKWRGKKAQRAANCVLRALSAPQWDTMQHQYRYYMLALLGTYPGIGATVTPSGDGGPDFE